MKRLHAQFFCLLLSLAPTAYGQRQTLRVAPEKSVVSFTLGDVLHTVHGTFHVSDGDILFDPANGRISGHIDVAAGSGASGNGTRDKRMSSDILDALRFPVASFAPQQMVGKVAPNGNSTVQVTGLFTIHGAPHPLTVPMDLSIEGDQCTAKTHFLVPYVQWGMKDPSTFVLRVAKEVSVDLVLVGQITPNALASIPTAHSSSAQ